MTPKTDQPTLISKRGCSFTGYTEWKCVLLGILAALVSLLAGSNDGSDSPTGVNVQDRGDHEHVTVYSGRQEVRVSFDENDKGARELHSTNQSSDKPKPEK